ncbi:MAG: MBL fold metallo-hydrolase [Bacteroidota bacterium]
MTVRPFTVGPFAENTYVLHDGTEAAVVDPGMATREERDRVLGYLENRGLHVRHLLLTHAHIDHVLGCAAFAHRFAEGTEDGGWCLHPADLPLLQNATVQGELFRIPVQEPPAPARELTHGDTLRLGETTLEVRHAPGHAPGHVVFYDAASRQLVGGDVLFAGSIGRTDLWGGDYDTLIRSIREQVLTLPDDVTVFSGHGSPTTVGKERRTNPFLAETGM